MVLLAARSFSSQITQKFGFTDYSPNNYHSLEAVAGSLWLTLNFIFMETGVHREAFLLAARSQELAAFSVS